MWCGVVWGRVARLCVDSKRPRVHIQNVCRHMCAWCRHTRGRVGWTAMNFSGQSCLGPILLRPVQLRPNLFRPKSFPGLLRLCPTQARPTQARPCVVVCCWCVVGCCVGVWTFYFTYKQNTSQNHRINTHPRQVFFFDAKCVKGTTVSSAQHMMHLKVQKKKTNWQLSPNPECRKSPSTS